jgi:hypothetical protein
MEEPQVEKNSTSHQSHQFRSEGGEFVEIDKEKFGACEG